MFEPINYPAGGPRLPSPEKCRIMSEAITVASREEHLYRFWQRAMDTLKKTNTTAANEDWNAQVYHLSRSGIGTEEALRHLYENRPSFGEFLEWLERSYIAGETAPLPDGFNLTKEDLEFWKNNGYIVIRGIVPPQQCEAARNAIWEFLNASPGDPETWYADHPGKNGMMLSFFQHAALDRNRQSPAIRQVFEQLYNSTDIFLLVDKVSFNPPEARGYTFKGSALHWDVSLHQPIPYVLQGLLYLNDVNAADGAFHCVPGFQNKIEEWLAGLPEGSNPREIALTELVPEAIPASAGDLIVWHQALPHCATANRGATPRMVQYITYKPLQVADAGVWI